MASHLLSLYDMFLLHYYFPFFLNCRQFKEGSSSLCFWTGVSIENVGIVGYVLVVYRQVQLQFFVSIPFAQVDWNRQPTHFVQRYTHFVRHKHFLFSVSIHSDRWVAFVDANPLIQVFIVRHSLNSTDYLAVFVYDMN